MTEPAADLRSKTVRGLVWQLTNVGGQQVLQLVMMSVVARNLDKPDIGLFFILLTGIGLVESLTLFMGEQSTIASPRGAERRYLDTVFTVRVLRSIAISLLLCALAPLMAWYFHDDATEGRYWLTGLFLAMAVTGFLDGLQSPARAARLKGLMFRRVVACEFLAFLLGTGVTIALAIHRKDVWALLIGHVATTTFRTTLSYVAAPHLPRITFDRDALQDLFHYSKGATGAPFLLFVTYAAPSMVLGRLLREALAVFEYAAKIAKIPENIFLKALGPVAIPAYAQLRFDIPRLTRAWLGAMRAFVLVGLPMTVAMSWCGGALPALAFGETYGELDSLFALQCLYGGLAGLTSVVGPLFWAIGQPHRDRRAQLARCITVYATGVPLTMAFGVIGFAVASCASIAVALLWCIVEARRVLGVSLATMAASMREGTVVAASLGVALYFVDLLAAPTGVWRVAATAIVSGPLFAVLLLRLVRQRRTAPGELPVVDAAS